MLIYNRLSSFTRFIRIHQSHGLRFIARGGLLADTPKIHKGLPQQLHFFEVFGFLGRRSDHRVGLERLHELLVFLQILWKFIEDRTLRGGRVESEIRKLTQAVETGGKTIVALRMYFKEALVKVEIATATGKKQFDKRADVKKREENLEARKALKHRA